MTLSRRSLLRSGAALPLASALGAMATAPEIELQEQRTLPEAFAQLKPIRDRIRPIAIEEFQSRIQYAQRLMADPKVRFAGLYVPPGSSLYYFAGIRWGVSERMLALLIPQKGDPLIICPAFEEGRLRELLRWPIEVRVWQEDEPPAALASRSLADRGIRTGRVGIEETTRYTFFNALRHAAPGLEYASGDPITIGCRARKSAQELGLMKLACWATLEVYRAVFASLREGMTQRDLAVLVSQGYQRMGLQGGALVLLGKWAAEPHGTTQPQKLVEGEVVLIDGGTSVDGYQSDVTRTGVLGKPSDKLLRAFDAVHKAQEAALKAAEARHLAGSVDDAARAVITGAGYGPGYKYFTHRLGHGIGLDGHEHPYLVHGSKTMLKPGMTFSNEPGIYVPGEFGIRLEDDMVVSEDGPARLLTPGLSASLEHPAG